jgi:hypothetical protein
VDAVKGKKISIFLLNMTAGCLISSANVLISLRLGFEEIFGQFLHPNLVSRPIKGILEIAHKGYACIFTINI